MIDVRDTGREFPSKCLSPFLYKGTIHAFLHSSGTIPVSSNRLKIKVIIGASSCAASLSIKDVMESGPVAFAGFEVFQQLVNTIACYCDVDH